MKIGKKITRSRAFILTVRTLVALYIELVFYSGRWRHEGFETLRGFWTDKKPIIGVFWHGRMMMLPKFWRTKQKLSMLISNHRDGELIAKAIEWFNFGTIRGSAGRRKAGQAGVTAKGGAAALRTMLKILESGESVAITPDGPRGPRMRVSSGVVTLAKMSGVPILPGSWSARRSRVFGSWDRFVLALPFSGGVFLVGEPVYVAPDATDDEMEAARQNVEDQLNRLTALADQAVGQDLIEPAPLAAQKAAE